MIKDILGSLPGCVGEATIMLIIFSGLSGIKGKKKLPIFLVWLASIFIPPLCGLIPNELTGWLLGYCISVLLQIICFRLTLLNGLMLTAIYNVYLDIAENAAMAVMPVTTATASLDNYKTQALGLGIITLLTLIIVLVLPVKKLFDKLCNSNMMVKSSVLLVYLIVTGDIAMSKSFPLMNIKILPYMVVILLVFATMSVFMAKQNQTIIEENSKLASYIQYQPIIEDLIKDVIRRQHDYDNKLQNIKALPCLYKTYDELAYAINEGYSSMSVDIESSKLLKINMKIFAAMLFSKQKAAEKEGITININPMSQNLTSTLPEYELSRCAGILIDNAIEAVSAMPALPDGQNYNIDIVIKHRDGKVEFSVSNPCNPLPDNFMDKLFKPGFTTKVFNKPQHGIGLSSLNYIITRNNGEIMLEKLKLPTGNGLRIGFRI